MTPRLRSFTSRLMAQLEVVLAVGMTLGSVGASAFSQEASVEQPLRLSHRSHFGEFVVPAPRRLGTFAVDLGLTVGGDNASAKTQYVMERVFARAASMAVQKQSEYRCNLSLLVDNYYPFILGFLYKGSQAPADPALSKDCVEVFGRVFATIERDDRTVSEALRDLTREGHSEQTARGDREHPKNPIMAAIDGIREFKRWIYIDDTTMHALVGVQRDDYASISVEQFRSWMTDVRAQGTARFVSDDPELARLLGERASNQVPALPPIRATKRSDRLAKLSQFESSAIRAAVFVAVDPPKDGKVTNNVTKKYCGDSQTTASDERKSTPQPRCLSDAVFGREYWLVLYFGAGDGSDHEILDRVRKIADDSSVVQLAAQRMEGTEPEHPYVALFGVR
jgi:hypothetical protein